MENKDILNFIFELGQLRRIKHEGWRLIKVDHPESVADHSLRAAQIGFILARLENYVNPYEVCSMVVFHDIGECRIGDIHKIGNRYLTVHEEQVVKDQTHSLDELGSLFLELWKQVEYKSTQAGVIAKDADLLEQAFTAKEYLEIGYTYAQDWITNIGNALKTESAKRLLAELHLSNSNNWWQGLKKL